MVKTTNVIKEYTDIIPIKKRCPHLKNEKFIKFIAFLIFMVRTKTPQGKISLIGGFNQNNTEVSVKWQNK